MATATYDGTVLEGKANRPIGWSKTAESHIITLNSKLPETLQGMIWQAISTPLCSPYLPLYRAMHVVPPGYSKGSDEYGVLSAYWSFRGLYALACEHPKTLLPEVQEMWKTYQSAFVAEHPFVEETLAKMSNEDPQCALSFAGRYSTGIAYEAVGKANRKRNQLMTKITQESD